ncbi:SurA N-terminal domain-containing protein [Nitrospira sp. Nam80]
MGPMNSAFTWLTVALLAIGLAADACEQREKSRPRKLVEVLPMHIATVDGTIITRDQVEARLEQFRSILAHQQHAGPGGNPGAQPTETSGRATNPHAMHETTQTAVAPVLPTAAGPAQSVQLRSGLQDDRELLRTIINQLALERLKWQEAERLGLTVSDAVIEEQVKQIEERFGSREAFEEALRKGHITRQQWWVEMRQALLFDQLEVRRRQAVPVSDEEIRRYWEENRDELAPLWSVERLDQVRDRVRDLMQQARWSTAKTEWEQSLGRTAKIWVNPTVRELLVVAKNHAH